MSTKFYQQCKRLKLQPFLRDQLSRASSSIPLNIAEGSGRRTKGDQARSYAIALGSLRECEAILAMEDIKDRELWDSIDQLGAMLYKLSNAHDRSKEKSGRKQI